MEHVASVFNNSKAHAIKIYIVMWRALMEEDEVKCLTCKCWTIVFCFNLQWSKLNEPIWKFRIRIKEKLFFYAHIMQHGWIMNEDKSFRTFEIESHTWEVMWISDKWFLYSIQFNIHLLQLTWEAFSCLAQLILSSLSLKDIFHMKFCCCFILKSFLTTKFPILFNSIKYGHGCMEVSIFRSRIEDFILGHRNVPWMCIWNQLSARDFNKNTRNV